MYCSLYSYNNSNNNSYNHNNRNKNKINNIITIDRNILKSDFHPGFPCNWESNKFSKIIELRSFYIKVKSTKYLIKQLTKLSFSFVLYFIIYYLRIYSENPILFSISIFIVSSIFYFSIKGLFEHFSKVPLFYLSEKEKKLYAWDFPIIVNSSNQQHQHQQLQQINNSFNNSTDINLFGSNSYYNSYNCLM